MLHITSTREAIRTIISFRQARHSYYQARSIRRYSQAAFDIGSSFPNTLGSCTAFHVLNGWSVWNRWNGWNERFLAVTNIESY